MAKIEIENLFNKVLEITDLEKTLLKHFHEHRIDWMQSCGGKGRCTTCKVIVRAGSENLSGRTTPELRYLGQGAIAKDERLSCQVKVTGDIIISVPRIYKLPHVRYSDDLGDEPVSGTRSE
ncbi:MAG TPA: 2Fe-2S iron-sulfur cluster-binding protein [Chryseosolibacter sp.]|nr:2Fe-2S iron-sulfur cluster-binding protein [Chryseosolibacter sp.]